MKAVVAIATSYLQPYTLHVFQGLPGCCLHLQTLKEIGWDKQPFSVIDIGKVLILPCDLNETSEFLFLDKLSGNETLLLAHMPDIFCADRALVGVGTNVMLLAVAKKLLRLSAFPGASPEQPWYRRPGWPLHNMYIVSRQSQHLLDPPSAHKPSSEKPGFEPPTVYSLKAGA